jgi:hypothetical protein
VVVVVLTPQVVDVPGPHQWPAELAGDADDALVGLILLGEPVLLNLEVDVPGPEGVDQLVRVGPGVTAIAGSL